MSKHIRKIFSYLLISILLLSVGWYAHLWYTRSLANTADRRVRQSGYKFISPLLDVELPEGYNVRHEQIPFKYKIADFVEQQLSQGNAKEISVYYRDMGDGPWFGINEKVKYNAASLMKVPVMIAWLKRAEKTPSVLHNKYTFDEKTYRGPRQNLSPNQMLKTGTRYTVEELLRFMMYYSDNYALSVLFYNLNDGEYENVFRNMDIANDPDEDSNTISVHGYSGFLRILYNAAFLNREMSEKALELMSYQDYSDGIIAGIPKGTKVASKYGIFNNEKDPNIKQLHEFGIVYHPKGPYILGILTRGNNINKQANILKTISEIVYSSVSVDILK